MPRLTESTTYKNIFEHAKTEKQNAYSSTAGAAGLLFRLSAVRPDTKELRRQAEGEQGDARLPGYQRGTDRARH